MGKGGKQVPKRTRWRYGVPAAAENKNAACVVDDSPEDLRHESFPDINIVGRREHEAVRLSCQA